MCNVYRVKCPITHNTNELHQPLAPELGLQRRSVQDEPTARLRLRSLRGRNAVGGHFQMFSPSSSRATDTFWVCMPRRKGWTKTREGVGVEGNMAG